MTRTTLATYNNLSTSRGIGTPNPRKVTAFDNFRLLVFRENMDFEK